LQKERIMTGLTMRFQRSPLTMDWQVHRQSTDSFQLSLTDARTGPAVWEGEKEIGKQGTRPSVGF
jgi:hypothetical protein